MSPSAAGLRRSLAILEHLSLRRKGIAFNQLRRLLGDAPPATVSRLLKVLQEEGWVEKSEQGAWVAGPAYVQAGHRLAGGDSIGDRVLPLVADLAQATGETAAFVQWQRDGFVFRAKCEMPDSYHHIGLGLKNRDVTVNGYGTACLAFQNPAAVDAYFRDHPAPNRSAERRLRARLADIAAAGFHQSTEKGLRFLAPVFAPPDEVLLGIMGISLLPRPLKRQEQDRYRRAVLERAALAQEALR